jgi:hypothetical protein
VENRDEQFERYLQQFRPKKPRALPETERPALLRPRLLLAIAGVVLAVWALAIGLAIRSQRSAIRNIASTQVRSAQTGNTGVGPDVSLGRLSVLVRTDPRRLDAALTESSRRLLPNVESSHGALHVLASE